VCVALLVFNAAASVRTAPRYLAFANDVWGGDKNTHRIFRGANVDTGQSMKLVSEYLASQNIKDCWLSSFVHPEMIRAVQPCRPMPSWLRPAVSRYAIDAVPPVIEGVVVLSANQLPPMAGDEYIPIAKSEPIAFIGANTYVYRGRFEVPLVAAISRVHRSNHFLRVNDIDQAISEALQAVGLGPNDARPHLALGLALARSGQKEEARGELKTAAELAKDDPRFRNQEVRANQELERLDRH
jgi:tetratricopeptide (TPR) repeat protein